MEVDPLPVCAAGLSVVSVTDIVMLPDEDDPDVVPLIVPDAGLRDNPLGKLPLVIE
jgi:hypothetical protein